MVFKLIVFGVVVVVALLSCFKNVNGLKCYACVEPNLIDVKDITVTDRTCKHAISNELIIDCPTSSQSCFKSVGIGMNGKRLVDVDVRGCASNDLIKLLPNENRCKSWKKLASEFNANLSSNGIDSSGEICVCDTDKCNPAIHVYPLYNIIIVGVLSACFGV